MKKLAKRRILFLDDDTDFAAEVVSELQQNYFEVVYCESVAPAVQTLINEHIDFAIVDLFLLGDEGAELSNNFVRDELLPRKIPYGRLSSAPGLVPTDLRGAWVMDKRAFLRSPMELIKLVSKELTL